MDLLRKRRHARDISPARHSRTRSPAWPPPAARPTQCCTCSPWRAKPASRLHIDDFQKISERTPLLADLKPSGRFVAADMHRAGGIRLLAKRLLQGKHLHENAMTVTGKTLADEAESAAKRRARK